MNKENMKYLFHPKSVAILGCGEGNIGGYTLENLVRAGFTGAIYPVNAKRDEVYGIKCYKSLLDIPGEVDCCVVALRASLVATMLDQMHEKGVKACMIYSSGFGEVGGEGKQLEEELKAKLKEYGIAACGPNCLGLVNLNENIPIYFGKWTIEDFAGEVGLIGHSGSVNIALFSSGRGFGYSYIIACGNEAGISIPEYIEYLADDDHTKIIALYMEAVRDPKALAAAARYAAHRGKPVVALRTGRSEKSQAAAKAHSGALATPVALKNAFFKRAGIIMCDSFDEMNETIAMFLQINGQLPTTDKIGLLAISGGELGYSCDVANKYGVQIAQVSDETKAALKAVLPAFANATNPLDVTSALYDPEAMKSCMRALAADPEIGMIVVCHDCERRLGKIQLELYITIVKALAEVQSELPKPTVMFSPVSFGLNAECEELLRPVHIPLLAGDPALRAVRALMEWKEIRAHAAEEQKQTLPEKKYDFSGKKTLTEREGYDLLSRYGIRTAKTKLATSAEDAAYLADIIGYPVVMKIDSPDILHKTDAHCVKVGVRSAEEAEKVYEQIIANAKTYKPDAVINGVMIQEMVEGGVECIIGVKDNGSFGMSVLLGTGGIFVEIFKDVALRLAPVTMQEAHEMIESLKGRALLHGARGAAPADVDALADAIVKVSQLAASCADSISEMDINPLLVLPEGKGVCAVDALVVCK